MAEAAQLKCLCCDEARDADEMLALPCSHAICKSFLASATQAILSGASKGEELNPLLESLLVCPFCRAPYPDALVPVPVLQLKQTCIALGLKKLADPALAPACLCGRECKAAPKCPPGPLPPAVLPLYALKALSFYRACHPCPTFFLFCPCLNFTSPYLTPCPFPRLLRLHGRVFRRPASLQRRCGR